MVTATRAVGVGAFVLAGLLCFAIGLFMIGDRQMAFADTFTLYTEFSKVTGLQAGAIVRVSGAKAGSITQIVPPGRPSEKFRVQLEIAESLHQLVRTDSVATIETEGLVGGSYLGIGTGTDSAPRAAPHATIAGRDPFEISDLMQQMGGAIVKVNETIDAMKGDVQGAVVAVADTMGTANLLIADVSGDVKRMTTSTARITDHVAGVLDGVRSGRGLVGKLMTDDELYTRVTGIARQTEETATQARRVVEAARTTLEGLQAKDGPVQGMTADVRQTMTDARGAMAGLSANMEALKHNFLLRGFFNKRGYFDLSRISPVAYRQGALQTGGGRQLARVWLRADELFELEPEPVMPVQPPGSGAPTGTPGPPVPDAPAALPVPAAPAALPVPAAPARDGGEGATERLTGPGRARLDAAIGPSLSHLASGILIVEGYAQRGALDEQYLRSRARGMLVRNYLVGRFHLDPDDTGAVALGAEATGSPGTAPWDGVALAVILPKGVRPARR